MNSQSIFKKNLIENKKILKIIGIGSIIISGAIFFATPYIKVNNLKQALERRDAAAVSEHIDFTSLKTNLKSMIQSQAMAKAYKESQGRNPFGMLGMGISMSYLDSMLDRFVSPEGISGLFQASKTDPRMNTDQLNSNLQKQADISMGYESFNEFSIKLQDKKNPEVSAQLILSRQNFLDWKVSGIRVSNAVLDNNINGTK
jgi:Protein of unknown function (DUF2939)